VEFRPLRRADFPLLARWLEEPRVARWWNRETTPGALERDFGPAIDGREPGDVFVAALDGRPFGIVQRYFYADYPDDLTALAAICEVPAGAIGIDYLIGEPDLQGHGVGPAMIAAFVEATWRTVPGAGAVLVPVAAGNRGSWRALERAGFERIAEGELPPDNPIDPPDHVVYRRERGA
jgi:aminoglycoside 6'-N-acetyltransferase